MPPKCGGISRKQQAHETGRQDKSKKKCGAVMTDLYESQRSMRHMRKLAMQRGVVAILDVGSSKIACLVLRFDGADPLNEEGGIGSLAGQSGFRVIGAATTRSPCGDNLVASRAR